MRIISHKKLKLFYEQPKYAEARLPLERWYYIASQREWHNLADILQDFGDTDMVGNQHYVFNIHGNKFRLVVVIQFTIQRIYIRFVGTHAEYDKIKDITKI
ncbi:type II toxin-antitoxin system HigB family toxin [Prevotella sp. AGR2160]|uniref:type II toxin-antitoxin system HigB family toxin n=1 Tax=Prevotella sp. AGR2160 TaxID=1280674 RepID=UPI00048C2043|nr:type II toxin-antitoxin system HigB family toxin [Prevotella sp. AGR2160]